jgi:hypothetical protein
VAKRKTPRESRARRDAGRGGALGDLAEELGAFLGRTEKSAAEWLQQRSKVTKQLAAIRDRASSLLSQIGGIVPVSRGTGSRRAGRAKSTSRTGKTRRGQSSTSD